VSTPRSFVRVRPSVAGGGLVAAWTSNGAEASRRRLRAGGTETAEQTRSRAPQRGTIDPVVPMRGGSSRGVAGARVVVRRHSAGGDHDERARRRGDQPRRTHTATQKGAGKKSTSHAKYLPSNTMCAIKIAFQPNPSTQDRGEQECHKNASIVPPKAPGVVFMSYYENRSIQSCIYAD
jgi:hypothetical protein